MDIVKAILEDKQDDPSKSTTVDKNVQLDIDVGTLLASDYDALQMKPLKEKPNSYLKDLTRDNVQLLINKIWELPIERVDEAVVATLPKPEYVLPRSRTIPKPKPLTKWQQFAKTKGILLKKNKKPKVKWDNELKKWVPTYGYKRAKAEEQKDWLVEVNNKTDPSEDPFSKAKKDKQERQSKNELQRLRNIARSKNVKLPQVGLPTQEHFLGRSEELSKAVTVARMSTASLGKFQSRLPKEKDAKGISKLVNVQRKRKAPPLNEEEEKCKNKDLADNILKGNTKILREDYSVGTAEIKSSRPGQKRHAGKQQSKTGKKPKGGKGKRVNPVKNVSGRKRRR
ncbi:ribosome biogenesis regulatory protein homolog [Pseudomyrmex gracilis]|uniref:ribosome biogenesis regulatory protein homolog n=1 Tax=Pseudomyrmex gracilis TaxID=219809 RepID=UPI000994C836|nr:ribosome biogenesis regulatory protein homolog [Pseudomyrmex gracilis]